jgi:hypothetical protein
MLAKYITSKTVADKLERVQYQAGLLVTGGIKDSSYNKILDELGWVRFSERVEFLRATLLYKIIN